MARLSAWGVPGPKGISGPWIKCLEQAKGQPSDPAQGQTSLGAKKPSRQDGGCGEVFSFALGGYSGPFISKLSLGPSPPGRFPSAQG